MRQLQEAEARIKSMSEGTASQRSQWTAQPSCSSKVSVQFILAGMPAIMAGTIISICQQAIPKLHQEFAVHILPTIFVQVAPEEISIESVGAAYRVSFRETVRTMEDLSNELASLLEEWKKTDTKFIFVTNVGIPPTPAKGVRA